MEIFIASPDLLPQKSAIIDLDDLVVYQGRGGIAYLKEQEYGESLAAILSKKAKDHNKKSSEKISTDQLRLVYLRGMKENAWGAMSRVNEFIWSVQNVALTKPIRDNDIRVSFWPEVIHKHNEMVISTKEYSFEQINASVFKKDDKFVVELKEPERSYNLKIAGNSPEAALVMEFIEGASPRLMNRLLLDTSRATKQDLRNLPKTSEGISSRASILLQKPKWSLRDALFANKLITLAAHENSCNGN